jgi:hypothetical protein
MTELPESEKEKFKVLFTLKDEELALIQKAHDMVQRFHDEVAEFPASFAKIAQDALNDMREGAYRFYRLWDTWILDNFKVEMNHPAFRQFIGIEPFKWSGYAKTSSLLAAPLCDEPTSIDPSLQSQAYESGASTHCASLNLPGQDATGCNQLSGLAHRMSGD